MLIVNEVRADNIRELTKKEKFLRLNLKSWVISILGAIAPNGFLGLYSFVVFIALLAFFYVIEFFDDDFTDIALNNLMIRSGIPTYYP